MGLKGTVGVIGLEVVLQGLAEPSSFHDHGFHMASISYTVVFCKHARRGRAVR